MGCFESSDQPDKKSTTSRNTTATSKETKNGPEEEVPASMAELMRLRWPSLQDRVCRAELFNHDVITVILGYCDVEAFRRARCVSQLWMSAACTTLLLLSQQPPEKEDKASTVAVVTAAHNTLSYQALFPLGCRLLEMRRFWIDRCTDPLTKFSAIYDTGHDMDGSLRMSSATDLGIDVNEPLRFPAVADVWHAPHAIYIATVSSFTRDEENRMIVANAAGSSGHFRIWINDMCVMSRGSMRGTKRKTLVEKDGRLVLKKGDEEQSGEEEVDDSEVTDDQVIQYTFRKGTTYTVRAEADGYWHACGWFINFNTQPYTKPMDAMKTLKRLMMAQRQRIQLWSAYTYEVEGKQQIRVELPKDLGPECDGVILFLGVYHTVEWVFETAPRPGLIKAIVYSQICGPSSCALRSVDGSTVSPHVFHLESASFEKDLPSPFTELGSVSRAIAVLASNVADFTRPT